MLHAALQQFHRLPGLPECLRALRAGEHRALSGTTPALLAALAYWLHEHAQRPVVLITPDAESAERLYCNLHTLGGVHAALFSAHDVEQDDLLPNQSVNLERIETLTGIREERVRMVATPWQALAQLLPAPDAFSAHLLRLACGATWDMIELLRRLFELGYERTEMVEFPGECSARGGIIDVFPVTAELPIRIEFMGDEISSLRAFDVHSQRSVTHEEVRERVIPPARESSVRLLSAESETAPNLLDYFTTAPLIIWHEFRHTLAAVKRMDAQDQAPDALRPGRRFDRWLVRSNALATLYAQELAVDIPDHLAATALQLATEARHLEVMLEDVAAAQHLKPHQYAMRTFARQLAHYYQVTLVCATEAERERLRDLLREECGALADGLQVQVGLLTEGWILPDCRQVVVTDDEIFARVHVRRRRVRRARQGRTTPIENIASVNVGDCIVHVNHGIGLFEGIRLVDVGDAQREMVVVRYADHALLYVPLEQAHLLERFAAVGDGVPQLDTLGGGRWLARRARAEHAVLDLAAELLERQAQRAAQPGHAFGADNEWQLSFEKAFPYAETPDQLRAIHDIKEDMQQARAMDRLICGDVGFGKTEVAMRAAFKAVMSGKQVAVLAPTTILAQQHLHTFRERMAHYPVRVEMLSRFVHAREQKATVRAVAAGQVDIVIGTHRLFAKDVRFHDLGLLVVDEEQRFGVRQKELLKQFRALVDVLALSATPIPRTLYQSLTSARDMSMILTPPEDRVPVKTLLIKRDYRVMREAIQRELARGGQVFFLHNRVETIDKACATLRSLLPEVRFVCAHGQMDEDELAATMDDFGAHRFDVLVCTMIIESGLDIPNVNTIIVDNAHLLGLADLYQLRGRVGRANRQAYAYLVIPADLALDGAARHRLKALLDNTALGSGYAIAMKDLEIRGAGNLLGAQQSGHIAAIGFSLYCRLLQRAVQLLKSGNLAQVLAQRQAHDDTPEGEKPARFDWRKEIPRWQPPGQGIELHLPFSGNIPEDYIESPALRLDIFRRIGQATQVKQLRALEEELRDRFGPLPDATLVALRLAEARLHARYRGVDCIEIVDDKVILRRRGVIVNPTPVFPRAHGVPALAAADVILATLARMHAPAHEPQR